jgi:hypothetical protein
LITSGQIRAARALLKWSAADVSQRSQVSTVTTQRVEVMEGVLSSSVRILSAIRVALEMTRVAFVGSPADAPGVRLRSKVR